MGHLTARADELARTRVPFVRATVVRARHPTSAHAGDTALVYPDGQIEGFVGGTCAEEAVRTHALEVLASGEPLLLRIEAGVPTTLREEGAVTVANPCLSGGGVEVFLEPRRPAPRLVVVGDTPVARALVALGGPLGWQTEPTLPAEPDPVVYTDVAAVVVASHGRGEEPALTAALRGGVPYVALVASRRRAAAVLPGLDVTDEQRGRVHSPAGLDIGARTAPEIAVAILAEIIAERAAARPGPPAASAARPDRPGPTAVDPVCGMTVAVRAAALIHVHGGRTAYFCGEHCRAAFAADPQRYAPA